MIVAKGEKSMYRIGEFSYLFELSIKTLRYYDEIDLFKPSYKDPFTGYRYYSENQKAELENILRLKDYGFTLEEIKQLKKELSEDDIISKIKQLASKQDELNMKIKKLEDLKNGDENKMKYKVGFASNTKLTVIGKSIVVENRDKMNIDEIFKDIECKVNKLKLNTFTKVIITEEVGYKVDDVELFIGYLQRNITGKEIAKINKCKDLTLFDYPTGDYLAAINVKKNDIITACKDIIEYSKEKNVQIIGPFIEICGRDNTLEVYTYVKDLVREEINDFRIKEAALKLFEQPFVPNDKIVGKWQIKEILPNIDYNLNRQKSIPKTDFLELEFKKDGTTNYENVTYSGNTLFIKTENGVVSNAIILKELKETTYLEIRMNDMSLVYPNAKPVSYIYVK